MKKLLLAIITLFIGGLSNSFAQTSLTSNVGATISTVMDISAATTARTFNFDNATKLSTGITLGTPITVSTKSNIAFKVTVAAADDFFQKDGVASTLPINTLFYSINSGTFLEASKTATNLGLTSTPGTGSFTVDYRMDPGFGVAPGTYTTVLTYTISAQ